MFVKDRIKIDGHWGEIIGYRAVVPRGGDFFFLLRTIFDISEDNTSFHN